MGLGFDCSNQTKRTIQRFRKSLNGSTAYSRAIPDGKPLRAFPRISLKDASHLFAAADIRARGRHLELHIVKGAARADTYSTERRRAAGHR